ncbi:hypothetical protein [Maribacter dokdonensis]|uniref:hypothetical protein n=1 Tax=Maribacter dokdonensis TaxID=320912 RepID=UPI003297A2F6
MEKPVKEIREDYAKYEQLIAKTKNTFSQRITLDEIKGNHQNTRIKIVDVIHVSTFEELELIVESKIENKKDFKFKLRAPEFAGTPLFRFDSDGVAHYNRAPNVELPKQKIDTPHFHRYDCEGRNIAYKTEALKEESEKEALLNDISLCMAHYCDESQTFYDNDKYIEIIQTPSSELDFESSNDNPTQGVEYD